MPGESKPWPVEKDRGGSLLRVRYRQGLEKGAGDEADLEPQGAECLCL